VVTGLNGCTILVADDERYVTTIISLKLRQAGATVITACDGQEALELAIAHLPDLICSDYQMSPMSGLELAEQLQRIEQTAHIPVLLLNSHGHRLSAFELAKTNIRALLPKPFSTRELLNKLAELAFETGIAA
jgi:two-component system chemotaxis response regulator CheY